MAGRRKAGNQRKRNVSLATSGLALFFLQCPETGAMFISQVMSEQQTTALPQPQRLGHASTGRVTLRLDVYVGGPTVSALLSSRA